MIAPARAGGHDSVVTHRVETGRGHERRQTLQKIDRIQENVSAPVAPAMLQAVAQSSILQLGEPIGGDRRARAVSGEPF